MQLLTTVGSGPVPRRRHFLTRQNTKPLDYPDSNLETPDFVADDKYDGNTAGKEQEGGKEDKSEGVQNVR